MPSSGLCRRSHTGGTWEKDLEAMSWEESWSSVLHVPMCCMCLPDPVQAAHVKLAGLIQHLQLVAHPSFVADPCYLVTFLLAWDAC